MLKQEKLCEFQFVFLIYNDIFYVIFFKNQSDISFLKEFLLFIFRCFVILMVVYRKEKVKVKFTFEMISYDNSLFCKDRWIFSFDVYPKGKKRWNFEKGIGIVWFNFVSIDLMLVFLSICDLRYYRLVWPIALSWSWS